MSKLVVKLLGIMRRQNIPAYAVQIREYKGSGAFWNDYFNSDDDDDECKNQYETNHATLPGNDV